MTVQGGAFDGACCWLAVRFMPRGALHARGSLAIGCPPAFTRLRRAALPRKCQRKRSMGVSLNRIEGLRAMTRNRGAWTLWRTATSSVRVSAVGTLSRDSHASGLDYIL